MSGDISVLGHLVDSMSEAVLKLDEARQSRNAAMAKEAAGLILNLHMQIKEELG